MKVLNFGSLNLDYVYQVEHFVAPGETLSAVSQQVNCGGKGLNQSVALPAGTNADKPIVTAKTPEDTLLWACNKWLLAHPDSDEAKQGAYVWRCRRKRYGFLSRKGWL